MKKINFKRFIPAICVLVVIIAIIVIIVCSSKNNNQEENPGNSGLNSGNVQDGSASNAESNENSVAPAEDNGLNVPQVNTSSTNEYVDDSGSKIEEGTVESIQENIKAKFKTIPQSDLKLDNVDLESARFIFGEGIMNIAKKDCFGFSVYVLKGEYLVNAGMYAMSTDTEVLYRYDTDTLTYIFVPMN